MNRHETVVRLDSPCLMAIVLIDGRSQKVRNILAVHRLDIGAIRSAALGVAVKIVYHMVFSADVYFDEGGLALLPVRPIFAVGLYSVSSAMHPVVWQAVAYLQGRASLATILRNRP